VLVFIASSIIHMVLGYHQSDFGKVAKEDDVMDAMRAAGMKPGDYLIPCGEGTQSMKDPVFLEKWAKGPSAFVTVMPSGPPTMGMQLVQWFVYCLLVALVAGYVAGRALGPGAEYLSVFRLSGTVAFAGFSLALIQSSIWYHRQWSATLKSMFDGLVYALLTAGCFGWLWPV
jgi:hypothetical protein